MSNCFIITSAINTRFGVFENEKRLNQTIETISSIQNKDSNAIIIIAEMSAIKLTQIQKSQLLAHCSFLIEFNDAPFVTEIFSIDNWDIVKNLTEVYCFTETLKKIRDIESLKNIKRFFKISGRYKLNNNFNLQTHEDSSVIIFSKHRQSQFEANITGIDYQYMSRLWSWPSHLLDLVIESYINGFGYMKKRISNGGYCDIEHMLFLQFNQLNPQELEFIGIEGLLGPNGFFVQD